MITRLKKDGILKVEQREKLFGTDGIRGAPGEYPLTDAMIYKIGSGIARRLHYKKRKKEKLKVIIGKDTRTTSGLLEAILADAISSHSINVFSAGLITTPGLSFLVKRLHADLGVMISASHNKPRDNGIKLFDAAGHKLSEVEEDLIEDIVTNSFIHIPEKPGEQGMQKIRRVRNAQNQYINFLLSTVKGMKIKGFKVAVDCAYGATSLFAKELFEKLGAHAYAIHDHPKGEHINIGGALDPSHLKKLVLKKKADMGIALDGDGDRGIIVDEKGSIIDGDFILAIVANYLLKKNMLPKKTIVGTVMSNLGLESAIRDNGGKIISTNVGDRHVLEAICENGLILGGEQSGHVIFYEYLPTPDGLLTGLQMLKVMKDTKTPLSSLAACMTKFPQVLVNIKVREKKPFAKMTAVSSRIKHFQDKLDSEGRILVRYSGTELLARVMVEGKDKASITEIANSLADEIKKEIGTQ